MSLSKNVQNYFKIISKHFEKICSEILEINFDKIINF